MTGFILFLSALRQFFQNFRAAVHISLVPYTVMTVSGLLATGESTRGTPYDLKADIAKNAIEWPWLCVYIAAYCMCWAWIAVNWHRLILLGEQSSSILSIHQKLNNLYVWASFKFTLLPAAFCIIAVLSTTAFFIFLCNNVYFIYLRIYFYTSTTIANVVFFFTMLRWTFVLPAIALGNPVSFWRGWETTKSHKLELFTCTVCLITSFFISNSLYLPAKIVINSIDVMLYTPSAAVTAWNSLLSWLQGMLSISLITVVFKRYVEGQET